MKTKVEIANYEIEIEEIDGVISVKAQKDDEVIEEFSIQIDGEESDSDMDAEDLDSKGGIKKFNQFQGEEDDFEEGEESDEEDMDDESSFDMGDDDDDEDEDDDDMDEDEDDMEGDIKKLESFQNFVNKRK